MRIHWNVTKQRADLVTHGWKEKRIKEYLKLILCPRDVHVSMQHQICCAHVILATVFKERDLEKSKWRGQTV